MGNIESYIQEQGKNTFQEVPFGEVDNLVFTYFGYFDLKEIVPRPADRCGISVKEAAQIYLEKIGNTQGNVRESVLACAAKSARFGDLRLCCYVDVFSEEHTQFAALAADIPDGPIVVTYRGVDNTLTGWKEAFQFSYEETRSQQMAAAYLERVLRSDMWKDPERPVYLTGHSKGGNMALYAALHVPGDLRDRIQRIYLNDAPGLPPDGYDAGILREMEDRIIRIVPYFSVLDSIYRDTPPDIVVPSKGTGLMQHEPYHWQVEGGQFVRLDAVAPDAVPIQDLVAICIRKTSEEERRHFIQTLFQVLHDRHDAGKRTDFGNLGELFLIAVTTMLRGGATTRRVGRRFLQAVAMVRYPYLLRKHNIPGPWQKTKQE